MPLPVPEPVRRNAREIGPEGRPWLDGLPSLLEELLDRWELEVDRPFLGEGVASWTLGVKTADGTPAALKLGFPHEEARLEADALRHFEGEGAVRLLRASEDGYSLLLERCTPGTDLRTLPVDEGNAVLAGTLKRLWRPPRPDAPFDRVADRASRWYREMPLDRVAKGYDPDVVDAATQMAGAFAEDPDEGVVVHGDLHPGNVLRAEREPWLAIDPKPLVGDPAFDVAQLLGNRCDPAMDGPDPAGEVRRQSDQVSELLDLERERVAAWAVVKSVGWVMGPDRARLLYEASSL